ncbi:hypothetical protein [uncultured Mailhella sp.]|uniref:hypothetical protein n=1 Tax=uncultured Mailhella sp. TaxID=1981031 RepID=UPI003207ED4C
MGTSVDAGITVLDAPYSLFDRDASRIILPKQLPPAHGALLMLWLILYCVDVRAPLSDVSSHSPPKLKSSASCAGRWILPVRPGIPGVLYLPIVPPFRKSRKDYKFLSIPDSWSKKLIRSSSYD